MEDAVPGHCRDDWRPDNAPECHLLGKSRRGSGGGSCRYPPSAVHHVLYLPSTVTAHAAFCLVDFSFKCSAMVATVPTLTSHPNGSPTNPIAENSDAYTIDLNEACAITTNRGTGPNNPKLFHKVENEKSILALAVSDSYIYAGTQDGKVKVGDEISHKEL